jgi:hypothetical protein
LLLQFSPFPWRAELTSGVAHDFNNLLTVVLGNLGFLEKASSINHDPKLQQRLSHMRLASERRRKADLAVACILATPKASAEAIQCE